MSLLVHALITFLLSFVAVTQKVTQYVRQEMQMEVAVNLGDSRGVEETLAIRSQMSGDLPVSSPAPPSLSATKIEPETVTAPANVAMDMPVARAARRRHWCWRCRPHAGTPAPQESAAKVTPTVGVDASIDVAQPQLQRVTQIEKSPSTPSMRKVDQRAATSELASITQGAPSRVEIPTQSAAVSRSSGVTVATMQPRATLGQSVADVKASPTAAASDLSRRPRTCRQWNAASRGQGRGRRTQLRHCPRRSDNAIDRKRCPRRHPVGRHNPIEWRHPRCGDHHAFHRVGCRRNRARCDSDRS